MKLLQRNFTNILEGHKNVWINYNYVHQLHYESINLQYLHNGHKDEPNFNIEKEHNIYKIDNVFNYQYTMFNPEIKIKKLMDISPSNNAQIYIILDCPGLDAFAHWVFEAFIFFPLFEKIVKTYSNVKILTSNKKKYVTNLLKFIGINNQIVYEIDNIDNICFIPPLLSLNSMIDTTLLTYYTHKFINKIMQNTISFNHQNNILFLPRNSKDNYFPDDRISIHLLRERRDPNEIEYISDGVIKNGGVVLNTYEINNFDMQFSIVRNSKNIILDYGSSFNVNALCCKGQNIIVLNKDLKCRLHEEFLSYKCLLEIVASNNNVIILNDYNNYEDIAKHFIM
jgi:hypothetical protein